MVVSTEQVGTRSPVTAPERQEMVISTHGLSKAYKAVKALTDLNLTVPRNSIFGFLGPNGSGKTTTIKLLLGLIKPTSGSGTVFGHDIVSEGFSVRKRLGYLAQEPRYYDALTARETLRFTARFFYSGPARLIEDRVSEMLELTGLTDKADRPIKGFSGGERQRLGIAQAQVNYPDLLILDEPAASLDPQGRHDVLAVMERLRKYTTIFYSTHILDDVQRVSDRVAILNKGQLIAEAPIQELLTGGSITYQVAIRGDDEAARLRVLAEPWVRSLEPSIKDGLTIWQVGVTDGRVAEERLPRLVLADQNLTLAGFGRKTYELEDIFLSMVEGSNHNGQ